MSSYAMSLGVEKAMMESLSEIQTQTQVQGVLTELVTDVEITVRLREQLQHRVTVASLEQRISQYEDALLEASALQADSQKESRRLAGIFLQELWKVSRDLGELHELRSKHLELLGQHDEVLAKMIQTEEDLNELRNRGVRVVESSSSQEEKQASGERAIPVVQGTLTEKADEPKEQEDSPDSTNLPSPPKATRSIDSAGLPELSLGESADSGTETKPKSLSGSFESSAPNINPVSATATPAMAPPAPSQPTVALVVDDDDKPPQFVELDTKILMGIFGFLDALEILNTAQTCVSLYSRIDALFGLGGGNNEEDTSTIATAEVAAAQATIAAIPSHTSSAGSVGSASASAAPSTAGFASTATMTTTTSTTTASLPASATTSLGRQDSATPKRGILSGFFEQANQAAVRSLANAKASPIRKPASPPQHKRSVSHDGAPMNASMASSMASKLTDAELNAIILMTERLKQKEAQAEKLKNEKEELAAKLDGVEGVKEFLIAKVRDMELSISQTVESETKVALQIASDQEVISFLDGRVQELEREKEVLQREKGDVRSQLEAALKQNAQKASVLGDMVQFEREKQAETEREFRAKKKVLVREIKTIRGQLALLQGERDGLEREIDTYRRQRGVRVE